MRRSLTGLIAFCATACATEAPVAWTGTIDTLPSGVIHTSNPDRGVWTVAQAWSLRQVARIGARFGSGPDVFGDIADIDVDAAGRVYVFDRRAQDVRVFARDGSYVRTIGRSGHGPGEFARANGIAIDPANRLWVSDEGNLRYSVFDSSGGLLTEPRRPYAGVGFVGWVSIFGPAGDLYEIIGWLDRSGGHFGLARYDTLAQDFVDTLPVPTYPEGTKTFSGVSTLTANGWWQGVKDTYRLWQVSYTGDTIRVVEVSRGSERLSAAERDSAERAEREMRRRVVQGDYDVETAVRPIFDRMYVDDLGYLWVMLTAEPDEDSTHFDVFDPDGRYLGVVTLPYVVNRRLDPVFRRGTGYFVTKGQDDVPRVVIAEIRRGR